MTNRILLAMFAVVTVILLAKLFVGLTAPPDAASTAAAPERASREPAPWGHDHLKAREAAAAKHPDARPPVDRNTPPSTPRLATLKPHVPAPPIARPPVLTGSSADAWPEGVHRPLP